MAPDGNTRPAPHRAVVGRFAPTPSGRMHLGNAFAALMAWLSARSRGGRILLRIEDLDLLRTSPQHTQSILDDLQWLGLDWDGACGAALSPGSREALGAPGAAGVASGGGAPGGGSHPGHNKAGAGRPKPETRLECLTHQSRRTAFYEAQLAKLDALGLLYPCYCSRAQLHAGSAGAGAQPARPMADAAHAPHLADGSYVYSRRCLHLSPEEKARLAAQRPGATRVRVPNRRVCVQDRVYGPTCDNLETHCGDFILRRSDGVFAYQLAAVADDGEMGVTEVVRGRDLLPSAPRQSWLARTLGYTPPAYAHLPLLLAPDGRRLSKRDGDTDLGLLRQRGIHPKQLCGALAFAAGLIQKRQALSPTDLLEVFSWDKLQKEDILWNGEMLDAKY